jgi:long-chain acyl-CoA synthetase
MFEIDEVEIRGVRTTVWKNCPATLGTSWPSRAHGTPSSSSTRTSASPSRSTSAPRPTWPIWRDRFGVANGDRVAIAMRNFPEWSVAFWAAAAAGAVVVPLNAWWTGEELHYGLTDSGTKVLDLRPGAGRSHRRLRDLPAGPAQPPSWRPKGEDLPTGCSAWRRSSGKSPRRRRSRGRPPPTTTPPSSTRRGRPGGPRGPSAPTATSAPTR